MTNRSIFSQDARSNLIARALGLYAALAASQHEGMLTEELSDFCTNLAYFSTELSANYAANCRTPLCSTPELLSRIGKSSNSTTIFVSSQIGVFTFSLLALAEYGLKVATVIRSKNSPILKILQDAGVELVFVADGCKYSDLVGRLDSLKRSGYFLFLHGDAPGKSREVCDFAGYKVESDDFVWKYLNHGEYQVVPIINNFDVGGGYMKIDLLEGEITNKSEFFAAMSRRIQLKPSYYIWTPSSIIFTDRRSLVASLPGLERIMDWVDSNSHVLGDLII